MIDLLQFTAAPKKPEEKKPEEKKPEEKKPEEKKTEVKIWITVFLIVYCLLWWLIKLGFWMKETFLEMTVLVFAEERGSSTKR